MAAALRERAVSAAVAVARAHGVEVREPRVLSDRSNVIVELAPAPVVARVAGSTADVRAGGARDWLARDVALATYLAWVLERLARGRAGAQAPGPAGPASHAPGSAASPARLDRVRAALQRIRSEIAATGLPSRSLHGDATPSNLLRTPAGLLWTDFEDSCAGPVEWDLACLVLSAGPGGAEALEAYGRRHDEPLEPFLEARRLQLALWTALLAERHPELRARAGERLSRWAPPR